MKTTYQLRNSPRIQWKSYLATSTLNKSFFNRIRYLDNKHCKTRLLLSNQGGSLETKGKQELKQLPFHQQANSKNLTPLHPGKCHISLSGKGSPQVIYCFLTKSPTSLQSCTKSCPGTFNFPWNLHNWRLEPGQTRLICFEAPCPWTTNCPQLETSVWTKLVTFTVPISASLKLARFKPSWPLMTSSGTSKWCRTQLFREILTHSKANSANDSCPAESECKWAE